MVTAAGMVRRRAVDRRRACTRVDQTAPRYDSEGPFPHSPRIQRGIGPPSPLGARPTGVARPRPPVSPSPALKQPSGRFRSFRKNSVGSAANNALRHTFGGCPVLLGRCERSPSGLLEPVVRCPHGLSRLPGRTLSAAGAFAGRRPLAGARLQDDGVTPI